MRRIAPLLLIAVIATAAFGAPVARVFGQTAPDEERKQLENQLAEYERQIDEQTAEIAKLQKEGKSLSVAMAKIEADKKKTELQIKALNLRLDELNRNIKTTTAEIKTSEEKLDLNRSALGRSLQSIYESNRAGYARMLLTSVTLSDIVGGVNDLIEVQDSLLVTIDRIDNIKRDLEERREALSLKRTDAAALKARQDAQREELQRAKNEKAQLLKATKGQESNYQKLLKETKQSAADIRQRIFKFLGGGELTFGEAYQYARLAEGATGVRAALLLSVLSRESGLGKNVGKCTAEKAMHPTRDLPIFNALLAELKAAGKAPPEPVLVSCAISSDGAYGGAMGPSQFIPSTWALYRDRVRVATGNNPPSPWNNGDAFMATAFYLQDAIASASCKKYAADNKNVLPEQWLIERCGAAKYYAGGSWFAFRHAYGEPVVKLANKFEEDIKVLNG